MIRRIINEEGLDFLGMYLLIMFTLLLIFVLGLVVFVYLLKGAY